MPPLNNSNIPVNFIKYIYFVFIVAPLLYVFVVYQMASSKGEALSFNFTDLTSTPFVFYFLGGIIAVSLISNYLGGLIEKTNNPMQAFPFIIIRYASIEFLAVLGLVIYFSEKNFSQFIALIAVALILILFAYPKQKAI